MTSMMTVTESIDKPQKCMKPTMLTKIMERAKNTANTVFGSTMRMVMIAKHAAKVTEMFRMASASMVLYCS